MSDGIYKIVGSMVLERERQSSVAKNLAGSNIPGYQRQYLHSSSFETALTGAENDAVGRLRGTGAGVERTDFTQGPLKTTGNELDFAISGRGFFTVERADGSILYTRNGGFQVNADGDLVTREGHSVSGTERLRFGRMDLLQNLVVSEDGTLTIKDGQTTRTIGKLKIMDIEDRNLLTRLSASYFVAGDHEGEMKELEAGSYTIAHKFLESANFSPIREMATMIESLREFEMAQRMIRVQDGLTDKAISAMA